MPGVLVVVALYRDLPADHKDDAVVFRLSKGSRQELVNLAALAPLLTTNLRAQAAPVLVATDASDERLAAVEAPIRPRVHHELWRHRGRRGHCTWLCACHHTGEGVCHQ